mmetsp:Transcript_41958/g.76245  ORF Transcript_41958/g.76245 Transcript_41958/m.76245 type:complete len:84 (-) Transcript_41958:179-430(-)
MSASAACLLKLGHPWRATSAHRDSWHVLPFPLAWLEVSDQIIGHQEEHHGTEEAGGAGGGEPQLNCGEPQRQRASNSLLLVHA